MCLVSHDVGTYENTAKSKNCICIGTLTWPWVITYGSILGRMNNHVAPILMFTRGTALRPTATCAPTSIYMPRRCPTKAPQSDWLAVRHRPSIVVEHQDGKFLGNQPVRFPCRHSKENTSSNSTLGKRSIPACKTIRLQTGLLPNGIANAASHGLRRVAVTGHVDCDSSCPDRFAMSTTHIPHVGTSQAKQAGK